MSTPPLKVPPYTYTLDPPTLDPQVNKRLGYRTPRTILLPPYLLMRNDYFLNYVEGADQLFGSMIDPYIDIMENIRNMWVTNPELEQKILRQDSLISFDEWSQPEREILVKQVNLLGMKLANAGIISNDSYHTMARFVGQYWFEKGTYAFVEFINFCLKTDFQIATLWTENYVDFYHAYDPHVGTPVWEGGSWYPTTHVQIVAKGGLQDVDPATLVAFFYEIANYNLVLESIDSEYDLPMTDRLESGHTTADVVAIGLIGDNNIVLSTQGSYGVDAPPTWNVGPQLPTQVWITQGVNLSTMILLGVPSAWIQDNDGDLIPVYSDDYVATVTDTPFIYTTLMGMPVVVDHQPSTDMRSYRLMGGPTNWIPVPGASHSKAKIPVYQTSPLSTSFDGIRTKVLGGLRQVLLCNPQGFKNAPGGGLMPYWRPAIIG